MEKQFSISLDSSLVSEVEEILDEIGLDIQAAIKVFFKRLTKERSLVFLMTTAVQESNHKMNSIGNVYAPPAVPQADASIERYTERKTNGTITPEMRDYLWTVFKQYRGHGSNMDYQFISKLVAEKTGMNKNSAFIYILMLDNILNGKENTRIMKFEDLVHYINCIKKEFSESEFNAALSSLANSIAYWQEHIPGRFAEKVASLVKHYK